MYNVLQFGTNSNESPRPSLPGVPKDMHEPSASATTPSPPIESLGFRGFDSSRLLVIFGGNYHIRRI